MERFARICAVILSVALASCTSPPPRVERTDHEAWRSLQLSQQRPEALFGPAERAMIVTDRAPPVPPTEMPDYEHRPDADSVWVPGYWQWEPDTERFTWVPGGFLHPPRERTWIAARWVDVGDGRYRFLSGYWR
jgi:hypothetical protein